MRDLILREEDAAAKGGVNDGVVAVVAELFGVASAELGPSLSRDFTMSIVGDDLRLSFGGAGGGTRGSATSSWSDSLCERC